MTTDRRQIALLLAGMTLFVLIGVHFLNYAPDDIYITMRYAANIADGHGAVYNPGEAVEGYSNPLFLGLLALLHPVLDNPWSMTLAAKIIGLLAGWLTLLAVAGLARTDPEGADHWGWAPLLVGLSGYFAVWAASGMETALHALLVLAAVGGYVRALETGRKSWRVLAGLLLGAAAVSRPEGVIFLAAVLVARALLLWRDGRRVDVADIVTLLAAATPIAIHLLWRHATYGAWLPNTFYAKAGAGIVTWLDGVRYLLAALAPALWGNALLLPLLLTGLVPWRKATPRALVLLLAVAAQAGFMVVGGGDWMPGWRFVMPVVPLLALTVPTILARFRVILSHKWRQEWTFLWRALLVTALVLPMAAHLYGVKQLSHRAGGWGGVSQAKTFPANYIEVADYLRDEAQPGDWLATGEAGLIPYLTGLPTIDCFGLTDAHLAQVPGARHAKVDPDYILGRRPRFVVIGGAQKTADGWRSAFAYGRSLLNHPGLTQDYRLAFTTRSFLVFRRASSAE
ncbi:MAG: hypothetical protein P9L99_12815 [Candidatus Lernaella stagnicola]|nr:hypothetical protein [Candidatus Lernaella stagnicola]